MTSVFMTKEIKDMACAFGLIFLLGIVLLFLQSPIIDTFTGGAPIFCDVHNPCPAGLKCINAHCAKTDPIPVREENPVPLLPGGAPAPYF
jgi:hypothetical protein